MSTLSSKNQQLLRERGTGWSYVFMWSILWRVTPNSLCGRALFMLIFFALAFVQMPLRADLAIGDAASPWVGDPTIGEARLVSAVTGTGDLQELPLGLNFGLRQAGKSIGVRLVKRDCRQG